MDDQPATLTGAKRRYTMRLRAEQEAQTRRRITESAVALHESLGPGRTSISALAEHAGVRRSTVYRHFPTDADLLAACSAHWAALHPVPDLGGWAAVRDPDARLRRALDDLYAYYRATRRMMDNLVRDAQTDAAVAHSFGGFAEYLAAGRGVLMTGRRSRGAARERVRAALGHALAYPTWRSLAVDQGLDDAAAADLMCRLVAAAGGKNRHAATRAQ
jgi:AcrR family transcriptional regulator